MFCNNLLRLLLSNSHYYVDYLIQVEKEYLVTYYFLMTAI